MDIVKNSKKYNENHEEINDSLIETTIILDSSGSMEYTWDNTIKTLSNFLLEQKKAFPNGKYSIVTFNSVVNLLISKANISDFLELKTDDLPKPNGLTALHDAIIKSCSTLNNNNSKKRIFVIILTDGEDNMSEPGNDKLAKNIISDKQKEGVDFLFLGAGIDSFTEAGKIGISYSTNINLNNNGPNNLNDTMRNLSDGICNLVRTNSTIEECPEMLRAFTEPIKNVETKFNKIDKNNVIEPLPILQREQVINTDNYLNLMNLDKNNNIGPPLKMKRALTNCFKNEKSFNKLF
jgi:uncharacterized protein YegL